MLPQQHESCSPFPPGVGGSPTGCPVRHRGTSLGSPGRDGDLVLRFPAEAAGPCLSGTILSPRAFPESGEHKSGPVLGRQPREMLHSLHQQPPLKFSSWTSVPYACVFLSSLPKKGE